MGLENLECTISLKNVRISPFKVRRVIDQIRGLCYEEALGILGVMPYRSCLPLLKLLRSSADTAKVRMGVPKSTLFVSKAYVDQGPVLKRFRPRAQGRGFRIRKPTCHISITLAHKSV